MTQYFVLFNLNYLLMFYCLIAIAAVIFTLLEVSTFFVGDFPHLNYDNKKLQVVCRLLFVICNILLFVAAVFYQGDFLIPYYEDSGSVAANVCIAFINLITIVILEAAYWIVNFIALGILILFWRGCLKIIGWVFCGDKDHFIYNDDD